jgi:hypothetical protein
MNLRSRDFRAVFILGCGATRGALPHVVFRRKRLKPPLNADFFKVANTYARACGESSPEAERLRRLKSVFREHLPVKRELLTMETAFSLLFMAKDFPEIYSAPRGRRRMPGDRQEIEDFLRLTSDILTLVDREGTRETEYDTLAAALRPHDVVISLNYDTLLDSSLVRRGWDPRCGYAIKGGAQKFNWRPRTTNRELRDVCLLKLHGSLNWFVRGSFADLSSVFSKKPTRIEKPRMNELSGHVRQIIPPIYGKFFDHDHWRTLWARAYAALREADALIVVGCSLIDTDFHLRAMIGRVVKYRKLNDMPFRHLFLVDRAKVRRRWAMALRGAYRNQIGYKTFAQFMRQEVRT